ncbi:kinesin-like protein Nod [Drosophila navojoa]|uniref:kinesin-like protein Nod n=1 Tax=Drosophila navojoa TaxID=7232 RepID=UPI0008477332|nr:kinesin-like protein Nod [Drosophila navojoa]
MEVHTDSVIVAVREAPPRQLLINGVNIGEKSVISIAREYPKAVVVNGSVFSFDYSFDSKASQAEIYSALMHPMVMKVLNGYNCTALAYGQTGTGKSYSMGITAEKMSEERAGIVPRCLKDFLTNLSINDQNENHAAIGEVFASFIEVYNEKAYDLLALDANKPISSRGQRFAGCTLLAVKSQKDMMHILLKGTRNRHVRATNMNGSSSRSHAIVSIHIHKGLQRSRLNIVDLAGSESVRRTGNEGMARTEGVYINMGLMSISRVMESISVGNSLVPYRESILTTVLQGM